jgi:hypothetical protein
MLERAEWKTGTGTFQGAVLSPFQGLLVHQDRFKKADCKGLKYGPISPGRQVIRATKFVTVALNILGVLVVSLLLWRLKF